MMKTLMAVGVLVVCVGCRQGNEQFSSVRGTITLYDEEEFKGDPGHRYHINLDGIAVNALQVLGNDATGKPYIGRAESAEWSIAPGHFVVFYQQSSGNGKQWAIHGQGNQPDLHMHDADNQMSAFRVIKP